MTSDFQPICYLIMRKDIPDMNPGKGMAQANHAGNDMTETLSNMDPEYNLDVVDAFENWKGDRTFGTCITLEMTEAEFLTTRDQAQVQVDMGQISGWVDGKVHDPTYPIRNHYGFVYTVPMDTCWWVFVYNETAPIRSFLKQFPLHR